MKIEVAKHERMSETGSSLMRLIQNNELSLLDLLVREAIQNSSDAIKGDCNIVNVNFNFGEFYAEKMNKHLEGITDSLNNLFSGQNDFIEVRDTNTTGLTGPLHHSEVKDNKFGNLINLVYEISKPQQKAGAGGSWGLGKTIYFRLGIGLVLYYSRILVEGRYQSRLVACLVEDETKGSTILPKSHDGPKRGIAWWGESVNTYTIPLTDDIEILEILSDVGIKPFKDDETGTAIIIPYIDKDKLLLDAKSSYKEEDIPFIPWLSSVENYMRASIQKWYAPKINNYGYEIGNILNPMINSDAISPRQMYPFFQVQVDLYNESQYSGDKQGKLLLSEKEIYVEQISLNNTFAKDTVAGEIIYVFLDKNDLKLLPPNNQKSPYEQLNIDHHLSESGNPAIISYCRKPGMIIDYDCNGGWTSKVLRPSDDEYLIGIFVPNSNNALNENYEAITLDEYLRKSEKADHRSWGDWTITDRNPQIVSKIKDHIARKINKNISVSESGKYEVKKTSIGKSMASILLPPENFGKNPSTKNRKNNKIIKKSGVKKSSINVISNSSNNEGANVIKFELHVVKLSKICRIDLRVISERGQIYSNDWESIKGVGSAYPFNIDRINITKFVSKEINEVNTVVCSDKELENHHSMISFIRTDKHNRTFGFDILNKYEDSIEVYGEIIISVDHKELTGAIHVEDIKGENNVEKL